MTRFLKKLTVSLICLGATLASSCIRQAEQKLAAVDDTLYLRGQLTTQDGAPVNGATVKVESDGQVLYKTDTSGQYFVAFTSRDLHRVKSLLDSERKVFYLYFEQTESKLLTVSAPISTASIGEKDLGTTVMAAPGTYTGTVLRADVGQLVRPATDSQVLLGPITTKVSADGTFSLANLPSGRIPLLITAPGLKTLADDVDVISTQTQKGDEPYVLFSGVGPEGLLMQTPGRSISELVQSGHSMAIRFRLFAPKSSRYIRMHHDPKKFDPAATTTATTDAAKAGTAAVAAPSSVPDFPWISVAKYVDYDFPTGGGQVLYYQFTDLSRTKISKTFQVGIDVDVFKDSTGFLNDNGAVYPSSIVNVQVMVPAAATAMRFMEDPKDAATAPWRPINAQQPYHFHPRAADAADGGEPIIRELYCQFQDAFGNVSGLFHSTFVLDLFSSISLQVGDGSGRVLGAVVPLAMTMSPDTPFVRMADRSDFLKTAIWEQSADVMPFRFIPEIDLATNLRTVAGSRQICVQFKDPNGFVSQALCRVVEVEIFPNDPTIGLLINGGALVSTSLRVSIDISVPPNATAMRFLESGTVVLSTSNTSSNGTATTTTIGSVDAAWIAASNHEPYTFTSAGTKILKVQFRDVNGFVSATHQQTIVILPIAESYAATDFQINLGQSVAVSPTLSIDIQNVPLTAIAMAVGIEGQISSVLPQPLAAHSTITVAGIGQKTIRLQFKNSDDLWSPVFKKTIDYNPFPSTLVSMVVNGGALTTTNPVVSLATTVTAPATAVAIRLGTESSLGTIATPYLPFQNLMTFSLPPVKGSYKIFYQLMTIGGDESFVFQSPAIFLDPFPTLPTIVLNGGVATTASPLVSTVISAPLASPSMMRMAMDPVSLASALYQPYQGTSSFSLGLLTGPYTVYAQLKSAGIESPIFYSSSINLNPFPPAGLVVTQNGGAATATNRTVLVNIVAPVLVGATMRIASDLTSLSTTLDQAFVSSSSFDLPNLDGTYRIYVQLRTAEGVESVIFQSADLALDVP